MLARLGVWSQKDHQLFCGNLAALKQWPNRGRRPHSHKPAPSPPDELCRLVRELAYRCGIRELRVKYIQEDGLRVPPKSKSEKPERLVPKLGRLIPFGDGWDELPKGLLDAYTVTEKPQNLLLDSCREGSTGRRDRCAPRFQRAARSRRHQDHPERLARDNSDGEITKRKSSL
jgi:hypothetical protein